MNDRSEKWKTGLSRTRKNTFGRIVALLGVSEIKKDIWDDLESMLVQADLGINTTTNVIQELKDLAQKETWTKAIQLKSALQISLRKRLPSPKSPERNSDGPTIILIVGVNGSGKTTTVAKLAKRFKDNGEKVLLAAADTFRAAAIEQLMAWGKKLDIRVVAGQPEGDPGAVTYDAIQSAVARKDDVLLIDTAGRLHTSYNLMEELKKVFRVSGKTFSGAPHEVWLVIDATTGQNALQQARAFKETVDVTGVILAKLDSSGRGGMAFAIQEELHLPILFAGLGEGEVDLLPFDPDAFLDGILADFG